MYCIISLIVILWGLILYKDTGDFNILFKMLLLASLFGICDSISSLSFKKFLEELSRFKPERKNENTQK